MDGGAAVNGLTLSKIRLAGGMWEGILTGVQGDKAPKLVLHHGEEALGSDPVAVEEFEQGWLVRVSVPTACIADGVQSFVISEDGKGEALADFSIVAGDTLDEDARAELALLRAELDLLKRAFRRHCNES